MSEGIRRLSLLLGLIGLACGLFFGWLAWDAVHRPILRWQAYESGKKLHEQRLQDWEDKVYETEEDGIKYRFSGSESAEDLAQALSGDEGRWYRERGDGWEEISDPDQWPLAFRPPKPQKRLEDMTPEEGKAQREREEAEQHDKDMVKWMDGYDAEMAAKSGPKPVGVNHKTEPLPGLLDYSKLLAFPLLGFLLPWGTVRVVGWVVIGFVLDWRGKRSGDGKQ